MEIENDITESCSFHLVFLKENDLKKDWATKLTLNFENVLFYRLIWKSEWHLE